ncbi:flagellar motor switch protein [Gracilibacillus halophilus YIM-C55.5]|uniref:Flagellar motor switch protein n=1 Tax=Gracilibacillus halophilus YIM-C55.5 TaxID=1308866 RepID=N4WG18_9BACI|nr:flagellar motor switch phosphatase FliY [Gracilibacillus halophilus]ENH98229.1 flagellar motor switch protein [Gracilibacillus halophilus YIM-C55.5]
MMDDGMLSQDEIDALLKGTDDTNDSTEDTSADQEQPSDDALSELEKDAIGEIGNISFGSSATTLSTLLNQKVEITTPVISAIDKGELEEEFPVPYVGVDVQYTEGISGSNLFMLESKDAAIIADLMLGGNGEVDSEELNDIHLSAVQEAMNQMMGTAATSMSTVFGNKVDISPPEISVINVAEDINNQHIPDDDVLVKVSFQLQIGTLIDSKIMQLIPVPFAKKLVDELLNAPDSQEETSAGSTQQTEDEPNTTATKESSSEMSQSTPNTSAQQPQQERQQRGPQQIGGQTPPNEPVQTASFSDFDQTELAQEEKRNLDLLMDIPLQVTVELGRTKRTVKDILELTSGSIVELDKLAGEPVDILVNQKLIAKGEVVVIDENFGVRVTDIVSKEDRLKQLK